MNTKIAYRYIKVNLKDENQNLYNFEGWWFMLVSTATVFREYSYRPGIQIANLPSKR